MAFKIAIAKNCLASKLTANYILMLKLRRYAR